MFLASLTVAIVFFGIRYEQRSKILTASKNIEGLGGRVIPTWQDPRITLYAFRLPSYFADVSEKRKGISVKCGRLDLLETEPPNFGIVSFFLGNNEDIAVSAISIRADCVDQEAVKAIHQLGTVKSILLIVDRNYLSIAESNSVAESVRQNHLEMVYSDAFTGASLVQSRFPAMEVFFRVEDREKLQAADNDRRDETLILPPEHE